MSSAYRIFNRVLVCALAVGCISAASKSAGSEARVRTYGDAVVKEVVSVLDGENFVANLRDVPPIIGDHIPVRIAGIDSPDSRQARPELRRLAQRARQIVLAELRSARVIKLKNMRRDRSAFRIIADVDLDGRSLAKTLIDGGYAKPDGSALEKDKR